MNNSLEEYRQSGIRAGRARKNNDEATARFESGWAGRAINLESTEASRKAARAAFDEGYKLGRGEIPVTPFR
jgi:hypothetical protein